MGKRKNKNEIKISEEELQPTTIGYLEESKKGFFGLIVLFLIFIMFAIFLPYINTWVNRLLGKDVEINSTPNIETPTDENEDAEEVKIYNLDDNLSFDYNSINFSSFTTYQDDEKYYISFLVTNNSDEILDFSSTKYYLETYSESNTLLGRHIFNNIKINKKYGMKQILELTNDEYSNMKNISISLKTIEDYPEVNLTANNEGKFNLNCYSSNENISYTYDKNNNLLNIKDSINYQNNNSISYKNALAQYQTRAANYNNKEGVSSTIVEVSSGFTHTTDIVVKTANIKELNNDNYYESSTTPKVVKFEMESRGYNCN